MKRLYIRPGSKSNKSSELALKKHATTRDVSFRSMEQPYLSRTMDAFCIFAERNISAITMKLEK